MNDLFLLYANEKPVCYALLEGMTEDLTTPTRGWFQVRLLLLYTTPPPQLTLGLNMAQLYKSEPFTMKGQPVRIDLVRLGEAVSAEESTPPPPTPVPESSPRGNVISLAGRKRKQP